MLRRFPIYPPPGIQIKSQRIRIFPDTHFLGNRNVSDLTFGCVNQFPGCTPCLFGVPCGFPFKSANKTGLNPPPKDRYPLQQTRDPFFQVTGMGITSCLGNTLDDVAESLKEGKSGITFSEEHLGSGHGSKPFWDPILG